MIIPDYQTDYIHAYHELRYQHPNTIMLTKADDYFRRVSKYRVERTMQPGISGLLFHLIDQTIRINRMDFSSQYLLHNNVASARNKHSSEFFLVYDQGLLKYDLYLDQLFFLGKVNQAVFKPGELYLIGLTDLKNLTRHYSEFSLYLGLLDAGHVLGNLKTVLASQGLSMKQIFHMDLSSLEPYVDEFCLMPFVLWVDVAGMANDLSLTEQISELPERPRLSFRESAHYHHLAGAIKEINRCAGTQTTKVIEWPVIKQLDALLRARQSAHTLVGNFNFTDHEFERVDPEVINHLISQCQPGLSAGGLEVRLIDLKQIAQANRLIHDSEDFFNAASYRYAIAAYVRQEMLQDGLFSHVALAAGELFQLIGIHFSQLGYAFRPLKNHSDCEIKQVLDLPPDQTRIIYFGLVMGLDEPYNRIVHYL